MIRVRYRDSNELSAPAATQAASSGLCLKVGPLGLCLKV
jgi:hypothetical protein